MKKINLSYVVTTRNKLPYLKEVMKRLLDNIQEDEEIVAIDGASTDGTAEFLQDLYGKGLIHKFLSEPDLGEAHGYNKGFLLAEGVLIKAISDDDMFCYESIRKCKQFMLEYEEIDILGTEGAGANWELENPYGSSYYYKDYITWLDTHKSFAFCGLGLMMRKKSLAYMGLFNTHFIRVDSEYTFRISALKKVNIAWYTGYTWVRMANPQSNSIVYSDNMASEEKILEYLYLNKQDCHKENQYVIRLFGYLKKIKYKIKTLLGYKEIGDANKADNLDWQECCIRTEKWLNDINQNEKFEFLFRK